MELISIRKICFPSIYRSINISRALSKTNMLKCFIFSLFCFLITARFCCCFCFCCCVALFFAFLQYSLRKILSINHFSQADNTQIHKICEAVWFRFCMYILFFFFAKLIDLGVQTVCKRAWDVVLIWFSNKTQRRQRGVYLQRNRLYVDKTEKKNNNWRRFCCRSYSVATSFVWYTMIK